MKRYISLLLCTLWVFSFYTCSDNPLLNTQLEAPALNSFSSDPPDGSTITISWSGNESAHDFRYRLELSVADINNYPFLVDTYTSYSDWSDGTSITLVDLDDGTYTFYVNSRLEEGIESENSLDFTIDDVPPYGLRFYPLYTEMSASSQDSVYIYVDAPTNLMGAEIEFTYNTSKIEFNIEDLCFFVPVGNCYDPGTLLSSAPDHTLILKEPTPGTILITFVTLAASEFDQEVSLNEVGSLVKLRFTALAPGTDMLDISESSKYIQSSDPTTALPFTSFTPATIVIQ